MDRDTGIAELEFIAEFVLTAGPLYKVCTCLFFESGSCQDIKQMEPVLELLAPA